MPELEDTRKRLQQHLTQVGVEEFRHSAKAIVRKGRVVGYVLSYSWQKPDVEYVRLLEIISQESGYGSVKFDDNGITLEISLSL